VPADARPELKTLLTGDGNVSALRIYLPMSLLEQLTS
jgi:hypothetical protein